MPEFKKNPSPFMLKSGNSPMYKNLGSSPMKDSTKKTRTIDKFKSAGLAALDFFESGGKKSIGERYRETKKYYRSKDNPITKATYTGKVRAKATGTTDTAMADS